MIIEIALGIVLGVLLLYLLPFIFAIALIIIPIILVIGAVVFGISIIPNEWIQFVENNYIGIIAFGTLAIMIFVIVGDLYGGFKESNIFKKLKIIFQKKRTDELSYGEKLGEYIWRFTIYLFTFIFLLLFFVFVYGVYISHFQ